MVGGKPGTMVVRIVQNDQGSSLPPDLVDATPSFSPRAEAGELVTLIDMDHFVEGNFDPDADWVVARAYEMHDHIIEDIPRSCGHRRRDQGEEMTTGRAGTQRAQTQDAAAFMVGWR